MIRLLGRATPTTTSTDNTLLQAKQSERLVCTSMKICNTSTATRTVRVHLLNLNVGETASVANALWYDISISANSTVEVSGTPDAPVFVLERSQEVVGRASVASVVTFHFFGFARPA